MKQYHKIWVYDNQGRAVVENKDYSIAVSEKENVIVLTIEELENMWRIASLYGYEKRIEHKTNGETSTILDDFKPYLQSKGIKID